MQQNIVDIPRRQSHQEHRKVDVAVRRTAAPIGMALAHERTAVSNASTSRKLLQTRHYRAFHLLAHGLDYCATEHCLPFGTVKISSRRTYYGCMARRLPHEIPAARAFLQVDRKNVGRNGITIVYKNFHGCKSSFFAPHTARSRACQRNSRNVLQFHSGFVCLARSLFPWVGKYVRGILKSEPLISKSEPLIFSHVPTGVKPAWGGGW